jgi:hypothetical protein
LSGRFRHVLGMIMDRKAAISPATFPAAAPVTPDCRLLRYRRTKVPRPWTRLTKPSWTRASTALRTVPRARPCSCMRVVSDGMTRPGGNSPERIWARRMLASCCQSGVSASWSTGTGSKVGIRTRAGAGIVNHRQL